MPIVLGVVLLFSPPVQAAVNVQRESAVNAQMWALRTIQRLAATPGLQVQVLQNILNESLINCPHTPIGRFLRVGIAP
jgi:hypothetical protein